MKTLRTLIGLVIAVSLFTVTGCQTPSTGESPDTVLLKMQERCQEKKSDQKKGSMDGQITFAMNSEDVKMDGNGKMDIQINFDAKDINNPKFDMGIGIDGQMNSEDILWSMDMDFDARMLEKNLYMKINNFAINSSDAPEISQQLEMFIPMLTNNWFLIPMSDDEITSFTELQSVLVASGIELTDEQVKEIEKLVKTIQLVRFIEDMGSGNGMYKYRVSLHNENIKKFIGEVARVMETPLSAEDELEIDELLNLIVFEATLFIDAGKYDLKEVTDGNITIAISDKESVDINFKATFNEKKTYVKADALLVEDNESANMSFEADLNTNPNTKFTVTAPENATNLSTFMMELANMGGGQYPDTTEIE